MSNLQESTELKTINLLCNRIDIAPSKNLVDTILNMQHIQKWMHNYIISHFETPQPFVGLLKDATNIQESVKQIQSCIYLKDSWSVDLVSATTIFKQIRKHIDSCGILVMVNGIVGQNTHRKLNANEFCGFSLFDLHAPLIFINTKDSEQNKLYTLLYEFVHILLGSSHLYTKYCDISSDLTDTLCSVITNELFIPSDYFIRDWNLYIVKEDTYSLLSRLSKKYHCNILITAAKALSLSYITKSEYDYMYANELLNNQDPQTQKKTKQSNYYKTLCSRYDENFLYALALSTQKGNTKYTDACQLTNTTFSTFKKLIDFLELPY